MTTARYFSAYPSDPTSRRTPCPPKLLERWLQVRLGRLRLSPACPFRLLHTFLSLRPARHYPRLWIQRSSYARTHTDAQVAAIAASVGEHVGALLRLAPARRDHHRDLGDAELPGGEYLAWPAIRPPSSPHQRRRRPAPLLDGMAVALPVRAIETHSRPGRAVLEPFSGTGTTLIASETQRIATGTVIKPIGARAVGKVVNDDRADWREAWALFPGSVAYIWHAGTKAGIVQDSLAACGFETRSQIIWAKNNFAIGRGHYHCKHEPCWYAVRKGSTGHWAGDRKQTTVWNIDKNLKSETGHGTQKPVECMQRPIENNSSPGQAVYEPFSGSGTTIIAAERSGRSCHAIELSPKYVDVAIKRWQDFTGARATLDGDGRCFDEIAAARAAKAATEEPAAADD